MSDTKKHLPTWQHIGSCLCCVDARLRQPEGSTIFVSRPIAASFSDRRDPLSQEAIHLLRLIDLSATTGVHANYHMEGHYDCKAVIDIWGARNRSPEELPAWLRDMRTPYDGLIRCVAAQMEGDYTETEMRRVFNIVKILQDFGHAMNLHEVRSAVDERRLNVVCTFQDLVKVAHDNWIDGPRYLFNPRTQTFVRTELSFNDINDHFSRQYRIAKPIGSMTAIIAHILKDHPDLVHNRVAEPTAQRPAANQNRGDAVLNDAGNAGPHTARHIQVHQP